MHYASRYLKSISRIKMSKAGSDSETKEDEIAVVDAKPGVVGRIEELCQGSICQRPCHQVVHECEHS